MEEGLPRTHKTLVSIAGTTNNGGGDGDDLGLSSVKAAGPNCIFSNCPEHKEGLHANVVSATLSGQGFLFISPVGPRVRSAVIFGWVLHGTQLHLGSVAQTTFYGQHRGLVSTTG